MSYYEHPNAAGYVVAPAAPTPQPQAQAGAGLPGTYPVTHMAMAPQTGAAYPYAATAPIAGVPMQRVPAVVAAQPGQPLFNFGNDRFMRGLLIGAAAAYLLTNEDVQRTVIKGAVKVWSTLQGGIEEAKERFRDAEAELQAAEQPHD
jgi:hypothetical protein